MSATEELRRMLDELGVEHFDTVGITEWDGENGRICRAYMRPEPLTVDVSIVAVDPAQAVEMTLERGTCKLPETRIDHGSIEYNGVTEWRRCSACGEEVLACPANYCPNCGREVVE